jgi:hypothetical protein
LNRSKTERIIKLSKKETEKSKMLVKSKILAILMFILNISGSTSSHIYIAEIALKYVAQKNHKQSNEMKKELKRNRKERTKMR